jgi:hypothetical protein
MRRVSAGACYREFGELGEGLAAADKSQILITDSHKTYYGISLGDVTLDIPKPMM